VRKVSFDKKVEMVIFEEMRLVFILMDCCLFVAEIGIYFPSFGEGGEDLDVFCVSVVHFVCLF